MAQAPKLKGKGFKRFAIVALIPNDIPRGKCDKAKGKRDANSEQNKHIKAPKGKGLKVQSFTMAIG